MYGLYDTQSPTAIIPLKSITFKSKIVGSIAETTQEQCYYNDSPNIIETIFCFPKNFDAAISGLKVTLNNQTIKAELKEKQKACEEYVEAVENNRYAAWAGSKYDDICDVCMVMIGNLYPNEKCIIAFTYNEELNLRQNKFWEFKIPLRFTPKYISQPQKQKFDKELKEKEMLVSFLDKSHKTNWYIEIDITAPQKINYLASPSDKLLSNNFSLDKNKGRVSLHLNDTDKDFRLIYSYDNIHEAQLIVDKFEYTETEYGLQKSVNGYAFISSFIPDFGETNELQESVNNLSQKVEFIFLIDCSGSMEGDRIKIARETLLILIASLPEDSYYNVYRFGSKFQKFFQNGSQQYSNGSKTTGIEMTNKILADMGGKEILNPLKDIFALQSIKSYPRYVFLLTDGAVSNVNEICNEVEKVVKKKNIRLFSMGIGNNCSEELIKSSAIAGNGSYKFAYNESSIKENALELLDLALQPAYIIEDIDPGAPIDLAYPNIDKNYVYFDGSFFKLYGILSEDVSQDELFVMKLKVRSLETGKFRQFSKQINLESVSNFGGVHKIVAEKIIKNLKDDGISKDKKKNLGLKYGVWNPSLAYIAVNNKNTNIQGQLKKFSYDIKYPSCANLSERDIIHINGGKLSGKSFTLKAINEMNNLITANHKKSWRK